jgi:ABC-type phosphate/phosphonate transport system ATPase subunit
VSSQMNMKTAAGVLIYSIEGNIGAGKSTLLHELERLHAARGGAEGCGFALRVLAEPVDEWCRAARACCRRTTGAARVPPRARRSGPRARGRPRARP